MGVNTKGIIKSNKIKFTYFLVILCGLLAPVGERMNEYIPNISKAFVIVGAIFVFFYIFRSFIVNNGKIRKIVDKPIKLYFYLILYFFLYSTVEHVYKIYTYENTNILEQYKIVIFMIISFFIFFSNKDKIDGFKYFVLPFNISFTIMFILFNESNIANTVFRAEGVYLNANAFAIDALFVMFTSLIFLSQKNTNKLFHSVTLVVSGVGLFMSGTRSAFIGLIIGILIYLFRLKNYKKKLQIILGIVVFVIIVTINLPRDLISLMLKRLLGGDSDISSYSNNIRLSIWWDYLKNWKEFIIIGLDDNLWNNINIRNTHNSYLFILVRYGFIPMAIYFSLIYSFFKKRFKSIKNSNQPSLIIYGMLVSTLITTLFIDALSIKTFWIIWSMSLVHHSNVKNI